MIARPHGGYSQSSPLSLHHPEGTGHGHAATPAERGQTEELSVVPQ